MPLIPSMIAAEIRAASSFSGSMWVSKTEAIGMAVFQWASQNPMNVLMLGTTTGTAGVGNITGKVMMPPVPGLIIGSCVGVGMTGSKSAELATAVSIGVSSAITKACLYQGIPTGVGAGTDISKVIVANAPTLIGLLQTNFRAYLGGGGTSISMIASGLGTGIAANVALAFTQGVGVSTGSPSPVPMVGASPMGRWV